MIVDFGPASEYLVVVSSKGIPLHNFGAVAIDVGVAEYCGGLRGFLGTIKNVKLLQPHGHVPQALILKLLTTDCESLCRDHTILLWM
jgi:hypothetical protein